MVPVPSVPAFPYPFADQNNVVTNQFYSIPGVTVSYDKNGNLLRDNLNTYTWDPNWGNPASINSTNLIYDALGRMVEQQNGSTYTQMLYNQAGKTAIMNGQTLTKAFVYLPGGETAIYNSSGLAYYRHADSLGSSRVTSTSARGVYSDSAYAPFGENYDLTGTADVSFTGQNADITSSLYDFTFREHSPSQGRWISPDPSGLAAGDPTNPQTWNRYAYVLNNPLSNVDPLGLDCIYLNDAGNGVDSIDHNSDPEECSGNNNGGYWIPGTVADSSWVTSIDQNNNQIGAFSQFDNGTLGWTASTNDLGGGWGTVGIDVATTPIPLTDDQAAMVAIANVFNNRFPTACTYSLSARGSILGLGVGINSTQRGTSVSFGVTSTLSNKLRITIGTSTNGLGAPDPSSTIRIGPPAGGLALNPTNGQVGAYVGKSFNLFGKETGATLTATVGQIGTNNSCANIKPK
jgi:RHS repeat-associated protein